MGANPNAQWQNKVNEQIERFLISRKCWHSTADLLQWILILSMINEGNTLSLINQWNISISNDNQQTFSLYLLITRHDKRRIFHFILLHWFFFTTVSAQSLMIILLLLKLRCLLWLNVISLWTCMQFYFSLAIFNYIFHLLLVTLIYSLTYPITPIMGC